MRRVHWALCALTLTACTPDFVEQWEVTKPRHASAKIIIDGDSEGRSRPRLGESFSIELSMMSPERPQARYGIALALCLGGTLGNGQLICLDEIPVEELGVRVEPYRGDDKLMIRGFLVPDELLALPPPYDQLDRFGLFGTVCVDGDVERVAGRDIRTAETPELFRCVNNEAASYKVAMPFTMSILLDREQPGQNNHHPAFACDPNEPDGLCNAGREHDGETVPGPIVLQRPAENAAGGARSEAWLPWDVAEELPWEGCADEPRLPKVRAGDGDYQVFVRFDKSDRESYDREVLVNGATRIEQQRESLIVSHTITTKGGEQDSYNTAVLPQDDDSEAEVAIDYQPPPKKSKKAEDQVPESGRLVRFYFALRDKRGGTDFTTRELCLLPGT